MPHTSLPTMFRDYVSEREGILSPNTFKTYAPAWLNFADYLEYEANPPVLKDDQLTLSHVEHHLQRWKLTPSSFNLRRVAIFLMLKSMRSRGYPVSFPYLEDWKYELKALKTKVSPRLFMTIDEINEVRECIPLLTEDQATVVMRTLVFDLIKELWLRISEVQQIDLQDINLADRTLSIRGKGAASNEHGKRAVSDTVDMSCELAEKIAYYIKAWRKSAKGEVQRPHPDFPDSMNVEAPLFVTRLGGRPTSSALQKPINAAIEYSGVKLKSSHGPHAIRRSMATIEYHRTHDIAGVSRKLRHSDLSTTMIYIGVNEKDLKTSNPQGS